MRSLPSRAFVFCAVLTGSFAAAAQQMPGDPAAGKKKTTSCQTCHGRNGMAVLPEAPNLAGQPEIYLAKALKDYRSGKRENEMMSVMAQALSDQDIADLAAWYSSLEIQLKPKP
ncbi:MAG: cytochrome c [Burkholderiales bacterium]|jgi:cytochrome c553|nr:cytochrome c [Burkholderiales bacterium]